MRSFVVQTEEINEAQMVQSGGCNAIEIVNLSDGPIYVDGRPVPAYASGMMAYPFLSYYGLEGEKMTGVYNITFDSAVTTKRVSIVRKNYV